MAVTLTEPRQGPSYDFDSAIKRRYEAINGIGEQANNYSQQLANRRVEAMRQQTLASAQSDSTAGFAADGSDSGGLRSQLVKGAAAWKGTNYVWGGESPDEGGFDCSGLIQYVYGKMGVKMPRVSQQQAQMGKVTPIQNLKQGDFVAWGNSPATASHIAIYAGNGMVWEAPRRGAQVRLRRINPNERGIMGIALSI